MELDAQNSVSIVSGNSGKYLVPVPEQIKVLRCLNLVKSLYFDKMLFLRQIISASSFRVSKYADVLVKNNGRHDILIVILILFNKKNYISF
jgi:hypothetical protein